LRLDWRSPSYIANEVLILGACFVMRASQMRRSSGPMCR